MLKIVRSYQELDVAQLRRVYEESITDVQDFYDAVSAFFIEPSALYAIWKEDGQYLSVLRIEPYQDGYLVAGLETVPDLRQKGYGKALLSATLDYLPSNVNIYSHIYKKNKASIAVHTACGFTKSLDYAVYLDGSVSANAYTYIRKAPVL